MRTHARAYVAQVYVLGNRTVVTKRPSLGDKYLDKEARRKGVMHLPRISCKADYCPPGTTQAAHQLAASVACDMDEFCEAPPEWITHTLVRGRGVLLCGAPQPKQLCSWLGCGGPAAATLQRVFGCALTPDADGLLCQHENTGIDAKRARML